MSSFNIILFIIFASLPSVSMSSNAFAQNHQKTFENSTSFSPDSNKRSHQKASILSISELNPHVQLQLSWLVIKQGLPLQIQDGRLFANFEKEKNRCFQGLGAQKNERQAQRLTQTIIYTAGLAVQRKAQISSEVSSQPDADKLYHSFYLIRRSLILKNKNLASHCQPFLDTLYSHFKSMPATHLDLLAHFQSETGLVTAPGHYKSMNHYKRFFIWPEIESVKIELMDSQQAYFISKAQVQCSSSDSNKNCLSL